MIRFPSDDPHAGMLTELVRAGRVNRADLDATNEADRRTISAEYAQMRLDQILHNAA
jgi:hypothetical protein